MHRLNHPSPIQYLNFDLLKDSYKLKDPNLLPWKAYGQQVKIQNTSPRLFDKHQSIKQPQITCNAFSKTKQLFRRRDISSLLGDDLAKQKNVEDQCPILPATTIETPVNKFQFESFGAKNNNANTPVAQLASTQPKQQHEDCHEWNSNSIQINFGSKNPKEISLSDCLQSTIENKFVNDSDELMESSIKQFCFKLNETPTVQTEITPIKKWSQLKIKRQKLATEPNHSGLKNKIMLKKSMEDCLNMIEKVSSDDLTDSFATDAKEMIKKVRTSLGKVTRRLNFEDKQSWNLKEKDDSTLQLFKQNLPDNSSTKRMKTEDTNQFQKKFIEKSWDSRKKQRTTMVSAKTDRKVQKKMQPFRF